MATIAGGKSIGGNSMFGGVGDNKSETQNNLFKMLPFINNRNKQYNDLEWRYNKVDYTAKPLPNTGIDQIYALNNYINGHPKNIKLVPYPKIIYPDTSYADGRNPTLLKSVNERYVDVSGTYYPKSSIKNKPFIDSSLVGSHKVSAKVH